jgi:F0F1-type ATP synthase epsilon subunit
LGRDLHLILEAHVVLDVLPGHADVVGDLVDLVALLGARQDAGAAQAVDGGLVSVVGLDVPIVVHTENLKSDYSGDEVRQGWRVNE